MPIVGNNITEVRIKIEPNQGDQLQGVRNNMLIKSIEEKKINNNKFLLFKCDLLTTYLKSEKEPLAQFMISEDLLYTGDDKELKELQKEWNESKKLAKKYEEKIIEGINMICMYDLQFFTNRMRFPPATGFNMNVEKDTKNKSSKKKKKKSKNKK